LRVGPTDGPETLVTNYQPMPRNILQVQRVQQCGIQDLHGFYAKDSGLLGGYGK